MNYQEKVSTRADVRALFEKVKANPAVERYRGYTETKSYGWDEAADDYVKCEGEIWFDNPAYDANFVTVGVAEGADAELLDEQLTARDTQIAALIAERDEAREACKTLEEALVATKAEKAQVEEKSDTVCRILCNLKKVLEAVMAYKGE